MILCGWIIQKTKKALNFLFQGFFFGQYSFSSRRSSRLGSTYFHFNTNSELKYEFSFSTEARFCQTAVRAKRKRRGIINEHQEASKKWLTLKRNGWLAFSGICNHVHILLKSNTNIVDVKQILGNRWLLGFSKTTRIKTEEDKIKILNYITKELKPSSKRISDINKIDSWLFIGNWEINKDN